MKLDDILKGIKVKSLSFLTIKRDKQTSDPILNLSELTLQVECSSVIVKNTGLPFGPSAARSIPLETILPIFFGSRLVQTTTSLPTNSSGL